MAPVETVLHVEVAYSPAPDSVDCVALELAPRATVADALQACGLLARHGLDIASVDAGVWGRSAAPGQPLRDRDRVEIYRPLTVDPKEARRQRYRRDARSKKA